MSKVLKKIKIDWSWSGDTYSIKGFNLAITLSTANPKTNVTAFTTTGVTSLPYTYTFNDVTLDTTLQYTAWVQALYDGKDSDWVSAGNLTVSDDGTATIATTADVSNNYKPIPRARFRYIRSWLNGNSNNSGSQWVELEVFSEGTNIALGKTVTASHAQDSSYPLARYTDGNKLSTSYIQLQGSGSGWQWLMVDLGSVRSDIDYLTEYHYFTDGREYNHRLEISEDGTNWFELFNSTKQGRYKELSTGKSYFVNEGNISSRLTTTESNISAMDTQINLRVTQTQVDTSISAIAIGAKNLLRNSTFNDAKKYWDSMGGSGGYWTILPPESDKPESSIAQCQYTGYSQNVPIYTYAAGTHVKADGTEKVTISFDIFATDINLIPSTIMTLRLFPTVDSLAYVTLVASFNRGQITNYTTGTWTRYSYTYAIPSSTAKYMRAGLYQSAGDVNFKIREIKVEMGTKATDWTPAIEDVTRLITTTNEATIDLLSTEIALKVSSSDFSSLIQQNSSSIKIAVGQIGGNNLAKNSRGYFGTSNWWVGGPGASSTYVQSISADTSWNPFKENMFVISNTSQQEAYIQQTRIKVKPNTKYTLSFRAMMEGNASHMDAYVVGSQNANDAYDYVHPIIIAQHPSTIQYYSLTYTSGANENYATIRVDNNGWINNNTGFNTVFITDIKLEEGDNATAWSPNPSELKSSVVTINDSGLEVLNGSISIKNKAGTQVLSGDTSGNLTIRGDFTTYDDSTGNMAMKLSKRSTYFYDWDSNSICGEIFAGKVVGSVITRGMVFGAYRNKFLYVACQDSNNNMSPVITVDNGAFGNAGTVNIESGRNVWTQNLYVSGTKNSIQDTEYYGKRLINAYETAEYYFGDIGSGKIDSNGECFVYIDEILQECVNTNIEYHVFTQVYEGAITKIKRYENFFIVHGEVGTEFSWELKAKRKGFEHIRLEQKFEGMNANIEEELIQVVSSNIDEELYKDLADELLEV